MAGSPLRNSSSFIDHSFDSIPNASHSTSTTASSTSTLDRWQQMQSPHAAKRQQTQAERLRELRELEEQVANASNWNQRRKELVSTPPNRRRPTSFHEDLDDTTLHKVREKRRSKITGYPSMNSDLHDRSDTWISSRGTAAYGQLEMTDEKDHAGYGRKKTGLSTSSAGTLSPTSPVRTWEKMDLRDASLEDLEGLIAASAQRLANYRLKLENTRSRTLSSTSAADGPMATTAPTPGSATIGSRTQKLNDIGRLKELLGAGSSRHSRHDRNPAGETKEEEGFKKTQIDGDTLISPTKKFASTLANYASKHHAATDPFSPDHPAPKPSTSQLRSWSHCKSPPMSSSFDTTAPESAYGSLAEFDPLLNDAFHSQMNASVQKRRSYRNSGNHVRDQNEPLVGQSATPRLDDHDQTNMNGSPKTPTKLPTPITALQSSVSTTHPRKSLPTPLRSNSRRVRTLSSVDKELQSVPWLENSSGPSGIAATHSTQANASPKIDQPRLSTSSTPRTLRKNLSYTDRAPSLDSRTPLSKQPRSIMPSPGPSRSVSFSSSRLVRTNSSNSIDTLSDHPSPRSRTGAPKTQTQQLRKPGSSKTLRQNEHDKSPKEAASRKVTMSSSTCQPRAGRANHDLAQFDPYLGSAPHSDHDSKQAVVDAHRSPSSHKPKTSSNATHGAPHHDRQVKISTTAVPTVHTPKTEKKSTGSLTKPSSGRKRDTSGKFGCASGGDRAHFTSHEIGAAEFAYTQQDKRYQPTEQSTHPHSYSTSSFQTIQANQRRDGWFSVQQHR
ncbi:uncharacterized protein BYT42DRAFT_160719 [Radiomyces spectabilis]|uniref:uncharacterized protein n=1 Tax=Radiomyces spectabilis TaxID=64574 RepID=UPI00221F5DAE|nr:uncharacterized protein BYT42DRAFT_160719 [Radiomyces spectabilis]KAI8365337.1 hypothetical protein BYT42DRAFT_160719 [Radiomyces spectabilis]